MTRVRVRVKVDKRVRSVYKSVVDLDLDLDLDLLYRDELERLLGVAEDFGKGRVWGTRERCSALSMVQWERRWCKWWCNRTTSRMNWK